jgi:hypothetical protein
MPLLSPALQYLLLSVRVGLVYMQPIPAHHPMKEQQEKRIKKRTSLDSFCQF